MNALPKAGYLILDDGLHRYDMQLTPVGPCVDILQQVNVQKPIDIVGIGMVDGEPVHLSLSPNSLVLYSKLKSIQMETWYAKHEDALVPVYLKGPDTIQAKFTWTPSKGMNVWFATRIEMEGNSQYWAHFAMAVSEVGQLPIYRPPFPNVHPNNVLCIGNDETNRMQRISLVDTTCLGVHQIGIEIVNQSNWNKDLAVQSDYDAGKLLFRFNAKGERMEDKANWKKLCVASSFDTTNRIKATL